MHSAFVLGAGLGTRLRPLTDRLPKPLVPVANRPLITYAFDHLIGAGVDRLIVNTHHCPEAYTLAFPGDRYRDTPITFRHEPVLLETGGGISNVADLLAGGGSFFVYNGDILTDLPLAPAIAAHRAHPEHEVTLVLRSSGPNLQVALDQSTASVTDISDLLGTGNRGSLQFTGVYLVRERFLERLPQPPEKVSVIPHFLDLIRCGGLGGVVIDAGTWRDLGDREAYLDAHGGLLESPLIDSTAQVAPDATIRGASSIGAMATIGSRAELDGCVVWPGAHVAPAAHLHRTIVLPDEPAAAAV